MTGHRPSSSPILFSHISPFQCQKQLFFYSPRHLRQSLTFRPYTFQMCAELRRKMATRVIFLEHLSRLRSERAIRTLGSKPCHWQSKRRQDITDLKLQAIYETPLRPWVWESSVNESSEDFSIKTMWSRSATPPMHSICDVVWLQGTELILWAHTLQRTTTNNNATQQREDIL